MKIVLVVLCLALTGCGKAAGDRVVDQCLRIQLAQQCLANLPAGPVATHYNDWDDVITECNRGALHQSIRNRQYVKPECIDEI